MQGLPKEQLRGRQVLADGVHTDADEVKQDSNHPANLHVKPLNKVPFFHVFQALKQSFISLVVKFEVKYALFVIIIALQAWKLRHVS